jgi:ParB/RepB/Spo0J family partition protein
LSTAEATKATAPGAVQTIKLSGIIADSKLWPRRELDADRVKEFKTLYKEEPGVLPPIIVAEHPKQAGKYRLVDGWHRLEALKQLKKVETSADVRGKDTDVFAEATRLSAVSSKPLTILEKRAAVRRLLNEHKDWSDRQIARVAGVSNVFVSSQHKTLTRIAGEVKDTVAKMLETDNAPPAREEPSISQLLFNVLSDPRVGNISLDTWRAALEKYPHIKPAARHVATVLFQASQPPAPAPAPGAVNANTSQKMGSALDVMHAYQQAGEMPIEKR